MNVKQALPFFSLLLMSVCGFAQTTPFEQGGENYSATYAECLDFYRHLDRQNPEMKLLEMGSTDAGLPLHLVLLDADRDFDPTLWHREGKAVILINNGIHPGEPDGIDASMLWVRDLLNGKANWPENTVLALIPVYNIGGCLNRSAFRRVDQHGPEEFGSRGNSQNLDLNRDFIKADSREARSFAEIFQWVNPDVFVDNHVSDGADYPNVMTLATSQHDKLGGEMGEYLHRVFEPALFEGMAKQQYPMIPYVTVWGRDVRPGWTQFFDSPRFSTGYATLFHTFGFTPETHMLKPYPQRVEATYKLMQEIAAFTGKNADTIKVLRRRAIAASRSQQVFPLQWRTDSSRFTPIAFQGYAWKTKKSAVSGLPVHCFDRTDLYKDTLRFYNYCQSSLSVEAPDAYILPQGWWEVAERLRLNGVHMEPLEADTTMEVEYHRIADLQTGKQFEGHYPHTRVTSSLQTGRVHFRKGDWFIPLDQDRKRFLVETLEPLGEDGYFAWNFFDAILGQKEGYSDYAYEDLAAEYLEQHPALRDSLAEACRRDPKLAGSASAQLDYVYKHSPWYEAEHNRYPVFRVHDGHRHPDAPKPTRVLPIKNKHDE